MQRKSKGRQKVQMSKMSKESNLLVTFSKRRSGLFKKASELSTLCGVEIAIIVFSPGKKVFSFGHPSVEAIIDRFLARNPSSNSGTLQLIEAHRNANVRELNMQLTEVLAELELEKKQGEDLSKMRKASQDKHWWETPVKDLGLEELEQLKTSMEDLKKNIGDRAEKLMAEATNSAPFFPGLFPKGGGSASGSISIDGIAKVGSGSGLGLAMTPHGYTLGFNHAFN